MDKDQSQKTLPLFVDISTGTGVVVDPEPSPKVEKVRFTIGGVLTQELTLKTLKPRTGILLQSGIGVRS